MPKATRLNKLDNMPGSLRGATREAMSSLWKVDGHNGLFYYAQGCKADATSEDGIVAEAGDGSFAIFKHDVAVEFLVKQALGVDDKTVANAVIDAVANVGG